MRVCARVCVWLDDVIRTGAGGQARGAFVCLERGVVTEGLAIFGGNAAVHAHGQTQ